LKVNFNYERALLPDITSDGAIGRQTGFVNPTHLTEQTVTRTPKL
jgi:hypothetical protein